MERPGELERLATSYKRHLRAGNKAKKAVDTYMESVGQFTLFLVTEVGVFLTADITKEHIEDFMASVLERRSPATASVRF